MMSFLREGAARPQADVQSGLLSLHCTSHIPVYLTYSISCIIDTGKLHLTLTNRVAKLVDRDQNSPSWRFLPVRDPEGGGKAVHILSLSWRFVRQGFITTFRLVLNSQPSYLRVPRAGHCRLASSCWALLLYAQVFLAL